MITVAVDYRQVVNSSQPIWLSALIHGQQASSSIESVKVTGKTTNRGVSRKRAIKKAQAVNHKTNTSIKNRKNP
ncbi:MAG: hypothetical protein AAGB24_09825 [Bacteroidota bacterium]